VHATLKAEIGAESSQERTSEQTPGEREDLHFVQPYNLTTLCVSHQSVCWSWAPVSLLPSPSALASRSATVWRNPANTPSGKRVQRELAPPESAQKRVPQGAGLCMHRSEGTVQAK
jgi:hypothetical protein